MFAPSHKLRRSLLSTTAVVLLIVGLSACQPHTKPWATGNLATYTYTGTQTGVIQVKWHSGDDFVYIAIDNLAPRFCWDDSGILSECLVTGNTTRTQTMNISNSTFKSFIGVYPGETFTVSPGCCFPQSGEVTVQVIDGNGNLTGDLS